MVSLRAIVTRPGISSQLRSRKGIERQGGNEEPPKFLVKVLKEAWPAAEPVMARRPEIEKLTMVQYPTACTQTLSCGGGQ